MNAYKELLRWRTMAKEAGGRWTCDILVANDRHVWRAVTRLDEAGVHYDLERLEGWERGVPNEWAVNNEDISLDQIAFWAKAKADADAAQGIER